MRAPQAPDEHLHTRRASVAASKLCRSQKNRAGSRCPLLLPCTCEPAVCCRAPSHHTCQGVQPTACRRQPPRGLQCAGMQRRSFQERHHARRLRAPRTGGRAWCTSGSRPAAGAAATAAAPGAWVAGGGGGGGGGPPPRPPRRARRARRARTRPPARPPARRGPAAPAPAARRPRRPPPGPPAARPAAARPRAPPARRAGWPRAPPADARARARVRCPAEPGAAAADGGHRRSAGRQASLCESQPT